MYSFNNKDKTIVEQASRIRSVYRNFDVTFNRSELKATGEIQPTARSERYLVEIKYHLTKQPRIRVLKPVLIVNYSGDKIPHTYSENILCLYQPKYNEFTGKKYISDTIIPWTSLWLYHYEVWHITNEWNGGGEHPEIK